MDENLKNLLREEEDLQFANFNEDTAWLIGGMLVKAAMDKKLPITIDITLGERQLFHASRPGASADNDEWVKRKVRVVTRFGHSSYYMNQYLKSMGKSIEERFLLPESVYGAHGGSFPILIKGSGVIGAITVSGLAQEEDHQLVTQVIKEFLNLKD